MSLIKGLYSGLIGQGRILLIERLRVQIPSLDTRFVSSCCKSSEKIDNEQKRGQDWLIYRKEFVR